MQHFTKHPIQGVKQQQGHHDISDTMSDIKGDPPHNIAQPGAPASRNKIRNGAKGSEQQPIDPCHHRPQYGVAPPPQN